MNRLLLTISVFMRKAFLAFLWVTLSAWGWLYAPEAFGAASDQLKHFLAKSPDMQGFVDRKIVDKQGHITESSGKFALMQPGRLRWELDANQLLISDGQQLFLFDEELAQVTVWKVKGLDATPAAILLGAKNLDKDFLIKDIPPRKGDADLEWLEAEPRRAESEFKHIWLAFRKDLPAILEFQDAFELTSRFEFRDLQKNPSFPQGYFQFSPPPGVDVLYDQQLAEPMPKSLAIEPVPRAPRK